MNFIKRSQLYFILSFAMLILLGYALLRCPLTQQAGKSLSNEDALFTATSAVCVTGLTVVDTASFNMFGQLSILFLIQLGGIGIMTLSASIIVILRHNMSWSDKFMIAQVSDNFPVRSVEKMLLTITTYTFITEALGFILLVIAFLCEGRFSFLHSCYLALFHSVSAFCNAGFSPFSDSLVKCGVAVKSIIAALIICGGLGVYVVFDVLQAARRRRRGMFRIHTKLVLWTTFFLICGGMLMLHFAGNISGMPLSWFDSFFQSVTARTAGFNSVPMASLHPASLIILITLMLIGASPGSTGGGIKTTTMALVFISIYETFKGRDEIVLFKRNIPVSNILKAFAIMFTFIFLAVAGSVAMSRSENLSMVKSMFEVASALGTVGLSLGTSMECGFAGKMILVLCMFFGRVGPFTFFLFLLGREKHSPLKYPEERIIMG